MSKKPHLLRAVVLAGGVSVTLGLGALCTPAFAGDVPSNNLPAGGTISRLSVATGSQLGGTQVTVVGTDLASLVGEGQSQHLSTPSISLSVATGGKGSSPVTVPVDPDDVIVVSKRVVRFVTPTVPATGAATLTITDEGRKPTTKTGAFAFTAAAPQITADAEGEVTADTGGTITVHGEFLGDAKTKVSVGGKAASEVKVTPDLTGPDTLTARVGSGLVDDQDVVISTAGGAVDAGTVRVVAAVPAFSSDGLPPVSTEKGATFTVTGENLDAVTGGTFTGADKKVLKISTAAVKKTVGGKSVVDPAQLSITIPKGAGEGEGSLVLSTKYTASEAVPLTVTKAGVPKLLSAEVFGLEGGGSELTLTGQNLRFISSVTVGKTAVKPGAYTVYDGEMVLPITPPTKLPAVVPVNVTTDGGTSTINVPFTETSLDAAVWNPAGKTITLNGANLKNLIGIKVVDANQKTVPATFTVTPDGKLSVATLKATPPDGTYTVTATDASTTKFSTTFTTGGPGIQTVTWKYPYITVTGVSLDKVKEWWFAEEGAEVGQSATVANDGKSATFLVPYPDRKTYTIAARFLSGKNEATLLRPVDVMDPGVTAEKVSYDKKGQVLTLTGTRTGDYASPVTLNPDGDGPGLGTQFYAAEDGLTATADLDVPAGKYTVSVADQESQEVASLPLTVTSLLSVTGVTAGSNGLSVAVDGAGLDKLDPEQPIWANSAKPNGPSHLLTIAGDPSSKHLELAADEEDSLPPGDYMLHLRGTDGVLVLTSFTVEAEIPD